MIRAISPGRINLIGEHTDYNGGFVLPAAIDKNIHVNVNKNGHLTHCLAQSLDLNEQFHFDLSNLSPVSRGWQNYILGVTAELQKLGAKLEGFNCSFGGNIPIGAGLSSSAALGCSLALALNELFDLGFSRIQLIEATQLAEHNFVGTKCGIMDQFASMMGKANTVIKLDCSNLDYEYFPLDLEKYQLLLINTKVSHSLADSEYNTRRAECEEVVSILQKTHPEITTLRDVTPQLLEQYKSDFRQITYQRANYILQENKRVVLATQALENKDFKELGQLIYDSHEGLQHDYEVSCKELDFLVDQTRDKDYILGARMMGGGFGGCTLNIIESDKIETFVQQVIPAYREKFGVIPEYYIVNIGDGAQLVSTPNSTVHEVPTKKY